MAEKGAGKGRDEGAGGDRRKEERGRKGEVGISIGAPNTHSRLRLCQYLIYDTMMYCRNYSNTVVVVVALLMCLYYTVVLL